MQRLINHVIIIDKNKGVRKCRKGATRCKEVPKGCKIKIRCEDAKQTSIIKGIKKPLLYHWNTSVYLFIKRKSKCVMFDTLENAHRRFKVDK